MGTFSHDGGWGVTQTVRRTSDIMSPLPYPPSLPATHLNPSDCFSSNTPISEDKTDLSLLFVSPPRAAGWEPAEWETTQTHRLVYKQTQGSKYAHAPPTCLHSVTLWCHTKAALWVHKGACREGTGLQPLHPPYPENVVALCGWLYERGAALSFMPAPYISDNMGQY